MTDVPDLNLLDSYGYELPAELIAQQPAEPRDHSRLLVYDRSEQTITHRHFFNLPDYLRSGDCLVVNQTRVVPARLHGVRDQTGGRWEGLFLRQIAAGRWEMISKTRGKLQAGETVSITVDEQAGPLQLRFAEKLEDGRWAVEVASRPDPDGTDWELLDQFGAVPLPLYIQQGVASQSDRERYQTVYAETPGAAAAPTAGLHFTKELLDRCRQMGVTIATVTLHVGLGTFRPVNVDQLDQHQMHAEWCEVTPQAATAIKKAKADGGRVIAVGTTCVRTLETASESGSLQPWQGESELFIRPGYQYKTVDALITNFHLPKSTLLILLAALMGYEPMMQAYQAAIAEKYRFYSYGDAMLIV